MNKNKKLKRYYVKIYWYKIDVDHYDDAFYIWASDEQEIYKLLHNYYSAFVYDSYIYIIKKCYIYTLICRLFNKVPKEPSCVHV